jgi:hypothetical protein
VPPQSAWAAAASGFGKTREDDAQKPLEKKIKQLKTVTKIISTETNAFKGIGSHPSWWLLLRLFR